MNSKDLKQKSLQTQLEAWKSEIRQLKKESLDASAEVKIGVNRKIRNLKEKVRLASRKFEELSKAELGRWSTLKASTISTWENLKTSLRDGVSRFRG